MVNLYKILYAEYMPNVVTLARLQTAQGKFVISAIDQRASMAKLLGVDHTTEAGRQTLINIKAAFMHAFSPMSSAMLIDHDFGLPALQEKAPGCGLLMSLEQSAYSVEDKEALPVIGENWGVDQIAGYEAAAKLVLYYNSNSPMAEKKRAFVQDLFRQTQEHNIPFLLEPIINALPGQSDQDFTAEFRSLQLQMVQDLGGMCDVLKIEFPVLPNEEENDQLAIQACQNISGVCQSIQTANGPLPWILLSRGMAFERFLHAVEIAMSNGSSGFAVGRAVWKEIGEYSTIDEQVEFMLDVAIPRLTALRAIVDTTLDPIPDVLMQDDEHTILY